MEVPVTVYVAVGAIVASLIAGFFSFLNFIGAKENKVSEFRLAWIDGLRNEIASYTAAVQEIVWIEKMRSGTKPDNPTKRELEDWGLRWIEITQPCFQRAGEALCTIQMRLNPKDVQEKPQSHEAKLMTAVWATRDKLNSKDFEGAFEGCVAVRESATPLLKDTWTTVKNGEDGYRTVRSIARWLVVSGAVSVLVVSIGLILKYIIS